MQAKTETQARLRAMLSVDEIIQIFRSLMCVFFCGGSYIEDISTHLMYHLSSHPKLKTYSADTILRAIKELTVDNTTYTSLASGKSYDFNTANKMNEFLVRLLISTRELRKGQMYDLDLFGEDSRHCKGTLQALLYPRKQVFGFLGQQYSDQ